MKTNHYFKTFLAALLMLPLLTFAQGVAINTDDSEADPSAMLEIKSNSKGLLIPRMTQAEIENITNPAGGLMVYSTTNEKFYTFVSSEVAWKEIAYGTGTIIPFGDGSIGTGGSCGNTVAYGDYKTGQALGATEFVTIEVNVTAIGAYSITTNTANGYSFSANGVYSSTGIQTVDLAGSGTPVAYQTDNFTATASNSGGSCTFEVFINVGCGGTLTDSRDAQNYTTVQIGTQCWMAQNLNIGTAISSGSNQTNNGTIEKYCYGNCATYGGLYQWDEMMEYSTTEGIQGICPTGWHLPTDTEWCTLENEVDAGTVDCGTTGWRGTDAGGNLKETGTTHWFTPNTGATNSSGFTALASGYRDPDGSFYWLDYNGYFWSSTENGANAFRRSLGYASAQVIRIDDAKASGLNVRCLQDEANINQAPAQPNSPTPADASTGQSVSSTLSWACSDPDGDPLTYDVYFGETNPPALVSSGQSATTYDPGLPNTSTTYYWKITATDNHTNSTEGTVWSFSTTSCGDAFTDTRDAQSYTTVQIGTQCWMAENLNIGTMINGSGDQTNNSTIEKYCFDDNSSNCDTYGGLYQWDEIMEYNTIPGIQGICPSGWHMPTDGEWTTLSDYLGGASIAGGKMKEAGTSHWSSPNTGATNSSGFTGLPAGYRTTTGLLHNQGNFVNIWSSTEIGSNAWNWSLFYNNEEVGRDNHSQAYGFSVRCIQGEPTNQPPSQPTSPSPADASTDQAVNTTLSWTCSDPEGDPLTYDVYFGETNPPALVSSGQAATTYDPGTLNYSNTYYWEIVAHDDQTNSNEGVVWSFGTEWGCGDALIDSRDSQSYTTVQIGTQCWMAENLNIGTLVNGGSNLTNNGTIEKYCYDNNTSNCDVYGGLYQWDEMMEYVTTEGTQGICPSGWHLPTDAEWRTLENYVDAGTISCSSENWRGINAGGNLKEAGTTHWASPNTGATNSSGFTGLPGGYRHYGGSFLNFGTLCEWWSSTQHSSTLAWNRRMSSGYSFVGRYYYYKTTGFSVRCVRD